MMERKASKQEEMLVESKGQQPVVVRKQINLCGAKGHSCYKLGF